MKFKEAVKDTNKALKKLNEQDYIDGFKYPFQFFKQGFRDLFYGLKQLLATISCLLVYPLLPILYPIAIIIRMVKK
jgi:hypothetical protein